MSDVQLRAMTSDDLPSVLRLEHELFGAQAWTEHMLREELCDDATRWYIVASHCNVVQGYAGLAAFGEEAHVMTIGTDPNVQGRGIGRLLLRALLAESARRGASRIILEVRVDNKPAIALYESEGFVTVGVRKRYYQPENVDAAVMIRG
ncbi:ribosomal protein S18-alanine N-acetyltransferase [Cumulibacter soli]|uniref:ribosomal protein S18-alanine N-acetyltransferase n=1 Tax=Cumulibacter soli TaxID=2546344 RepID=UPI001FBA3B1E|nr:ribosomal protein S18-alanine N-acetyltransferase [Cumulibacter soli]